MFIFNYTADKKNNIMKTKEWLKSNLQNGEVLRAEVLGELLDSYFHKTETGYVERGDTQPVVGGSVYVALQEMQTSINREIEGIVRAEIEKILPDMLAGYLTVEQHDEQKDAIIGEEHRWVENKLAEFAKKTDVEERFRLNDDKWDRAVTERLEPYVLAERVSDLVDLSEYAKSDDLSELYAKKTELPDMAQYVSEALFTNKLTELNTAIAAKATSADVAEAKQQAIEAAAANTSNVCALKTDFGSDGIYLRTTIGNP